VLVVDFLIFANWDRFGGDLDVALDGEVVFFEVVFEGSSAREGWIGESTTDRERRSPCRDGAAKSDLRAERTDVSVTLITAVGGAGAHVIVKGDAGRLGVSGGELGGGSKFAGGKG